MTHTSGLPRLGAFDHSLTTQGPSAATILDSLSRTSLQYAPDTAVEYSNLGGSLLGLLVARVSGQPYRDYVSQQVLAPLGMAHSVWEPEDVPVDQLARPHELNDEKELVQVPEWRLGASEGAGGLFSSVEDMARFAAFQLSAWPPSSLPEPPVLRRASLSESQSLHVAMRLRVEHDEKALRGRVLGNGLGWGTLQNCNFEHVAWHNGGTEGHSAILILLPRRGVALVVLTNGDEADPDGAAFGLLTALDRAVAIPARDSVPHLDATWSSLVQESLTLVQEFSEVRYEAVFDRRYREGLPAAKAQALFSKRTERFSRCRLGKPLAEYHPILRAAHLACERGGPAAVEAAIVHDHLVAFRITPLERAQERTEEFLARSHRDACEDQRPGEAAKAER